MPVCTTNFRRDVPGNGSTRIPFELDIKFCSAKIFVEDDIAYSMSCANGTKYTAIRKAKTALECACVPP